jgi:hypothetical protein
MLFPLCVLYNLAILLASAFIIATLGFAAGAGRATLFVAGRWRRVVAALIQKPN